MYVYEAHLETVSRQKIEDLQVTLRHHLNQQPRQIEHLHATVWFAGDVDRIVRSLEESGIEADAAQLEDAYQQYLKAFPQRPIVLTAAVQGLQLYGSLKNVLALSIKTPPDMQALHDDAEQSFATFLKSIGMPPSILATIRDNPEWRWVFHQQYRPHISLFKDTQVQLQKLNHIHLPAQLEFGNVGLVKYVSGASPQEVV